MARKRAGGTALYPSAEGGAVSVVIDVYGVAGDRQRHPKCRCPVPCQGRFRCASPRHIGNRSTPWCNGGEGEDCDDCWCLIGTRPGDRT